MLPEHDLPTPLKEVLQKVKLEGVLKHAGVPVITAGNRVPLLLPVVFPIFPRLGPTIILSFSVASTLDT